MAANNQRKRGRDPPRAIGVPSTEPAPTRILRPRPTRISRPDLNCDPGFALYTVGTVPEAIRQDLADLIDAFHNDLDMRRTYDQIVRNATDSIRLMEYEGQGNGYRAERLIPAGTDLAVYSGIIKTFDPRRSYNHEMLLGNVGLNFRGQLVVDGNPSRFPLQKYNGMLQLVNHACSPNNNCIVEWTDSTSGLGMFILRSHRDIHPGEQLTFQYHPPRSPAVSRTTQPTQLFWRDRLDLVPAVRAGQILIRCQCGGTNACPNGFWRMERAQRSPPHQDHSVQLRTQDPAILTPAELAVDQSGDEMQVNSCDTFSPQRPNSPNALGAIAGPQHLSVTEVTPQTLPTEPATFTQLRPFPRSTSVVSVAPLADTTAGDGSISLPRQQSPCPSSEASLDLHDPDNSSHIITVNVGPMGLAEALPSLVHLFDNRPAAVLFQECHLPKRRLDYIRRRVHTMLPCYCLFSNNSNEHTEVVTLLHYQLAARASLLNISEQARTVDGVIPDATAHVHFLRAIDPISNVSLLIGNCYQYQANYPQKQQAMLRLVAAVRSRWAPQSHHFIVAGDWNASLQPRQGYSGTDVITRADAALQEWHMHQDLLPALPTAHTWTSADRSHRATLDFLFSRDRKSVV